MKTQLLYLGALVFLFSCSQPSSESSSDGAEMADSTEAYSGATKKSQLVFYPPSW